MYTNKDEKENEQDAEFQQSSAYSLLQGENQ